jgi:DNA-binding NarL/FixJ family response regulator
MARIRVVIADVPRVLRDIISTMLAQEPDIEMLQDVTTLSGLVEPAATEPADVVVVGLRNAALPDVVAELFERRPTVRVLGIAGDGRHAYLHELRPHRTALGELSPEQLVRVIRDAGRSATTSRRTASWLEPDE